jgi:hypothetical protein
LDCASPLALFVDMPPLNQSVHKDHQKAYEQENRRESV